jgi:hypothetical protein
MEVQAFSSSGSISQSRFSLPDVSTAHIVVAQFIGCDDLGTT